MNYKGNTKSFNVNSFNKIVNTTIADDKARALQWLSSLEPQKRHQNLRESRLEGVGKWIFRTSEFQRWNMGENGSDHSVLFCHGNPGVGKTHLSSLLIDRFWGSGPNMIVTGLYCDYLDRKEQTTSNMLGAILKQLVGSVNKSEDILKALEDAKDHFGGVRPQVQELIYMLKTAIGQRQRVVICVDGLDELLAAHRTGLLTSLQTIAQELPNIRLFLTGRCFIRGEVEKSFPSMDTISIIPTKEDTREFLRMKLGGDLEPDAMDESLRADIMEIIPQTISEIFLLISLSIEAILAEPTIHLRREKLKQISKGHDVADIYTTTFGRIKGQESARSRLGMEAIMWVAYSEQPLKPGELCQALGVEVGSKDLNKDNTPTIQTIMSCGLGLVTVNSSSSTVRLVHFTLQEYILANPTLFPSPHSTIAEVCLTYLNFTCIRDLSPTLSSPPPTTLFLEYASCFWGAHARREVKQSAILLALKLLDKFDAHVSCKLLLLKEPRERRPLDTEGNPIGFTGLHAGAFFGVLEIMVSLLGIRKWDLNATDLLGSTVLVWGVRKGHGGVVKMLLEQEGVIPDMTDTWGRTPLLWAADGGHKEITKILLERNDVNPDIVGNSGRSPLSRAAGHGHEEIVKMLLERSDVDPDKADNSGCTPLSFAVFHGCEVTTKMLLERSDVDPAPADENGCTPLFWAAKRGYGGVAEMLLQRSDLDPNTADKGGHTPLSWAAIYEHERIVKMILERSEVDPDTADADGRTPLSRAAENEDEAIVEMLLQRSDVNPDTADKSGRTPLSWAAESGDEAIVEMLLQRSDVNPDMVDKKGRTPLSFALIYRQVRIVDLLLGRKDANPSAVDKGGRTSSPLATGSGHEVAAEGPLQWSSVDPATATVRG